MNQEHCDPEIFNEFIVEAKEHLESIEPNLLLLEKRPDDLSLLDAIFRPMHSLKGASGFLGLPQINNLAHKAENILDELRKGNLRVTPEIMDIILASTDALRMLLDNLESMGMEGDVDTQQIIERISMVLAADSVATFSLPSPSVPQADQSMADAPIAETSSREAYPLSAVSEEHLADFLEESQETIADLNQYLLRLERRPGEQDALINDIFRCMHNLKGNSGLLGYMEMNALTHEAESLLGLARKGEFTLERRQIDLLLAAVDQLDGLVKRINPLVMTVVPSDVQPIIDKLRQARLGENLEPDPLLREASTPPPPGSDAEKPVASGFSDLDDAEIFAATARQQLDNMSLALETLARDSSQQDYVDGLYRSLISLQNAANYMGFNELKIYAERTANLVDQARGADLGFDMFVDLLNQERSILEDMVAAVLKALDRPVEGAIKETVEHPVLQLPAMQPSEAQPLEGVPDACDAPEAPDTPVEPVAMKKPGPEVEPASPKPFKPQASRQEAGSTPKAKASATIRVDHERLDHLMNLIGELIINRNRFAMLSRSLEDDPASVEHVAQQLTESTYAMARISDDLQDTIMQVRMVSVSAVFSRFPRLVRDLSRKSGKQVELITEGEETELDKSIVEVIGDPMVHLVRNAMDHGLEPGEERLAAGKSAAGRIWLRAYHKGNSVAIEIEDDGRGIDPVKMRSVAVKKGLMTEEEAARLDDREAIELIFAPGFSSAETITDISGRGVGMDVVRTNIKNLKGTVNIFSELGKGARVTLSLPLTLAIIDALMVSVAEAIYAIPLDAVSETTKIEADMLTDLGGRKAVTLRDEVLGIVDLRDLLNLPRNTRDREILPVVVIADNERRMGLVVDRLLERQEVVIKPLGEYLGNIDGISGATIMGDGSVVLILDPHEIYGLATMRPGRTP